MLISSPKIDLEIIWNKHTILPTDINILILLLVSTVFTLLLPLAPPGCRDLLYNDSTHRLSYGIHGVEAFYPGPALEHYRCYRFFVPTTGGTRICATAQFPPIGSSTPSLSSTEQILVAANDLMDAIKQPSPLFSTYAKTDHLSALKKIATIFKQAVSTPIINQNQPSPHVPIAPHSILQSSYANTWSYPHMCHPIWIRWNRNSKPPFI